jgi:hypothetical protein
LLLLAFFQGTGYSRPRSPGAAGRQEATAGQESEKSGGDREGDRATASGDAGLDVVYHRCRAAVAGGMSNDRRKTSIAQGGPLRRGDGLVEWAFVPLRTKAGGSSARSTPCQDGVTASSARRWSLVPKCSAPAHRTATASGTRTAAFCGRVRMSLNGTRAGRAGRKLGQGSREPSVWSNRVRPEPGLPAYQERAVHPQWVDVAPEVVRTGRKWLDGVRVDLRTNDELPREQ